MKMIVICRRLAIAAAVLAVGVAACGGAPNSGSGAGQGADDSDGGGTSSNQRAGRDRDGTGGEPGALNWPDEPPAHAQPVLRAVITEHDAGKVHVIDVASGDPVRTLRVDGQATVELAGDDTHLILTQAAEDVTHLVDAGIRWVDHGGHVDPAHVEPEVAGSEPTENPVHVVRYADQVAVFADDEGAAYVWRQGKNGLDPEPVRTLRTERPHHGFGIPLPDGRVLAGLPDEQRRNPLPVGVRLYDEHDGRVRDFRGCPALHGEYGHEGTFVFGCADGALVLEQHDDHWHVDRIPNPDEEPGRSDRARARSGEEPESGARKGSTRLGAFYGGGDDQIIGTFGNDAMALVDLEKQRIERIELPASRVDAIWDPYWEQVVVLTSDGKLHAIDPHTGELRNSTQVLSQVEISSDPTEPRPSISTGENWIYLTDPQQQKLIEVGITSEGFEPRRAKDLGFVPYSIGVLGMAG